MEDAVVLIGAGLLIERDCVLCQQEGCGEVQGNPIPAAAGGGRPAQGVGAAACSRCEEGAVGSTAWRPTGDAREPHEREHLPPGASASAAATCADAGAISRAAVYNATTRC